MFLNFLARLPLRVLYVLSDILYVIMRHVWRYRRSIVQNNLRNAFPEQTPGELDAVEERFYRNFCDMFLETMKAGAISREELIERVEFTNIDVLETEAGNNQSVILLVAHQFNWEWLLLAMSIHAPHVIQAIYKPPHLKSFDRFLYAARTRFGAELLPQKRAVAEIRRQRDRLKAIAMLADQSESGVRDDYWTEFMNQTTAFSRNIQRLALMTQYPVYFGQIRKISRGHYSVTGQELARPPYERDSTEVLDAYVRAVEAQIRAWPDSWLWTNRKWKQRGPAKVS
ncbi:MAG: lipid A biosynthesis acyltransferase [Gammaproteobacteria bacterium]|nr:MAG: lipid A biosynthesis acyltransferase [Gammaproteobacteria bacterium]